MHRGEGHPMITSYHDFFEDARGNSLPFFGASQDDLLICEYKYRDRFYMSKYMDVLMG
ncbi:hypothetical protein [Okeania sp. SIO1F9]|uniref:hypothetical protein n=1 Tax=Okeania sp. SIO1F9 TaxID=2607813 RepID=UPI0025798EAA|nr:hypothetical protein [Okeania sp. SIO1F9]